MKVANIELMVDVETDVLQAGKKNQSMLYYTVTYQSKQHDNVMLVFEGCG